jgi:hypothetical protein
MQLLLQDEDEEHSRDRHDTEGDDDNDGNEDGEDDELLQGSFSSGKAKIGSMGKGRNSKEWASLKAYILKALDTVPGELLQIAARGPQ